jgi:hypothetical protein
MWIMKRLTANHALFSILLLLLCLLITGSGRSPAQEVCTRNLRTEAAVPVQSVCTIFGRISGRLKWPVATEPGGKPTIHTVKTVILEFPDRTTRQASINSREEYRFSNVPIGNTYTIYLVGCRTDPPLQKVTCRRANATYHRNFKVVGGPIID